jgi:hypothetical protein
VVEPTMDGWDEDADLKAHTSKDDQAHPRA